MTATFSPAQFAILAELAKDGADNAAICQRLNLSMDTVKCQIHRALVESRLPNRTALAVTLARGELPYRVADRRYRDRVDGTDGTR
jgi:DNA-binding NarL/FixJ family response regulator